MVISTQVLVSSKQLAEKEIDTYQYLLGSRTMRLVVSGASQSTLCRDVAPLCAAAPSSWDRCFVVPEDSQQFSVSHSLRIRIFVQKNLAPGCYTDAHPRIMAPYRYQPLSSPATQIRLLELLPGRGTIRCRLRITELEQAEYTYEPISYCWKSYARDSWWGCTYKVKERQRTLRILVDGADLYVGESLHAALWRMRPAAAGAMARLLWADAVCINQADDAEKGAQVTLMGRIYEGGARTLAWLGEADRRTGRAFRYIRDCASRGPDDVVSISSRAEEQPGREWWAPGGGGAPPAPGRGARARRGWFRGLRASLGRARLRASLESIVNRPYFRRAWIVQEITMSYCLLLMCGKFEAEWRDLSDEFVGMMPSVSGNACFTALDKLRCGHYQYDLMEVASMVSPTQASDARDKLYGILGMVPSELMTVEIDVDYTKDPEAVFCDLSRRLLLADRKLGALCMSYGMSADRPGRVPTWVWNPQPDEPHARFSVPSTRSNQYRAAGETRCQPEFFGSLLGLRGVILEKVAAVSSGWDILPRSGLPFHIQDPRPFAQQILWYFEHRAIGGISADSTDPATSQHRRNILFRTTWPYKFSTETPLPDCDQLEEARTILDLTRFDSEVVRRFERYMPGENKPVASWSRLKLLAAIEMLLVRRALGDRAAKQFWKLEPLFSYLNNRRLAKTTGGYIALCPRQTAVSDRLVLLQGSDVPFILRPAGGGRWQVVGECYVHAPMDGSAWDESRCEMLWIE